jgi:hypothetical protein
MEILAPTSFRLTPMEFCDVPVDWYHLINVVINPIKETDRFILKLNSKLTKNGIIAMNYFVEPGDRIRLKNTNIPISLFTRQTSVFGDNWTVTINKDDKIGVLHKLS